MPIVLQKPPPGSRIHDLERNLRAAGYPATARDLATKCHAHGLPYDALEHGHRLRVLIDASGRVVCARVAPVPPHRGYVLVATRDRVISRASDAESIRHVEGELRMMPVKVPVELYDRAISAAARSDGNLSAWVRTAMIEKLERDGG